MDAVFAEYVKRFADYPAKNSRAVKLYVFETRAGYVAGLREMGVNATNTAGVFFSSEQDAGLATFVEDQSSVEMFHVLQHEGFHQFAQMRMGSGLPQWANEGLAEYFGQSILVKGDLKMGLAPEQRIQAMALAVKTKTSWPFEKLLNMSNKEWNDNVRTGDARAGMMYDQSWTIVHFLVEGAGGKYRSAFVDYIKLTSQGMQGAQAFERAFKLKDVREFEDAWKRYILQEMRPDGVSTALERMQFLAVGAWSLFEEGVMVESMGDLKKEMQARQMTYTIVREGVKRVMSSKEDSMFDAPPRDEAERPTSMEVVAAGNMGAPAGLRVKGLKVGMRLVWDVRPGRPPRPRVEFE